MNNFQVFMICVTLMVVAYLYVMAVIACEEGRASSGNDGPASDLGGEHIDVPPGGREVFLLPCAVEGGGWNEHPVLQENIYNRPFVNQIRVVLDRHGYVIHTEAIT